MERVNNKEESSFVRLGMRISFYFMVAIWVLSALAGGDLNYGPGGVIAVLWIGSTLFTFITSILHLLEFKERALALTALVLSSYLIITFLIGVGMGMAG